MGAEQTFFASLHMSTERNYLGRMMDEKPHCMEVARRFDRDFFDGDRRYGFGGYHYDGRWLAMAEKLASHYHLSPEAKVLEAGCGKGYLLFEFTRALPRCSVSGFDISAYAIENGKPEIRSSLSVHDAKEAWPYDDNTFDFVYSVATLHNLAINDLVFALREMRRVGKKAYLCVESYRTSKELFALQCWALTAESFFSNDEWRWLFQEFGYTGDYEFIHF